MGDLEGPALTGLGVSTMVENVSRALAAHSWELGGNDHALAPFVERRWPMYTAQARAAIEASGAEALATAARALLVQWDTPNAALTDAVEKLRAALSTLSPSERSER